MSQGSSPVWRRWMAASLAAVVVFVGVGVAVAGQDGTELTDPFGVAAETSAHSTESSPVETSTKDPSSMPVGGPSAPVQPVEGGQEEATHDSAHAPLTTSSSESVRDDVASTTSSTPSATYTQIDRSRIFGERAATADTERTDVEGLAADVEAQVRACVAELLGGIQSSFDDKPDADRIQSFASEVVDDVLACVEGLVDVGQVLGCVGEVIQEIVAVVMAMDFSDLPDLISEIADDVMSCVSPVSS